MKRGVITMMVLALVFCMIGCTSVTEEAESLAKEGKYQEAISLLEEDGSEEAMAAREKYVVEYADQFASEGNYTEAVGVLQEYNSPQMQDRVGAYIEELMTKESFAVAKEMLMLLGEGADERLLIKCNLGIVWQYVNENGKKGKEGKRIFVDSGDVVVYVESGEDNTLIMGYSMTNSLGGNQFDLYVDGTKTPYFEAEQNISFFLMGQPFESFSSAYGTVDISYAAGIMKLDITDFTNKGAVDTSGNTVVDLVDEESFTENFNKIFRQVMQEMPKILQETGLDITMEDLGFHRE